jgi:hypothetical protein
MDLVVFMLNLTLEVANRLMLVMMMNLAAAACITDRLHVVLSASRPSRLTACAQWHADASPSPSRLTACALWHADASPSRLTVCALLHADASPSRLTVCALLHAAPKS